jgi:hypothetical protein
MCLPCIFFLRGGQCLCVFGGRGAVFMWGRGITGAVWYGGYRRGGVWGYRRGGGAQRSTVGSTSSKSPRSRPHTPALPSPTPTPTHPHPAAPASYPFPPFSPSLDTSPGSLPTISPITTYPTSAAHVFRGGKETGKTTSLLLISTLLHLINVHCYQYFSLLPSPLPRHRCSSPPGIAQRPSPSHSRAWHGGEIGG